MGGKNSHGNIVIEIENSSLESGGEISGTLHLLINKPLLPSTLILGFKGKEETHWNEVHTECSEGKYSSVTSSDNCEGKFSICDFEYPIYSWDNEIQPGGYSQNFIFRLPDNLPGTFHFDKYSVKASIHYWLKAKLVTNQKKKIKNKIPIHIRQSISNFHTSISLKKHISMKSMGCINRGICKLGVTYLQESYNPEDIGIVMVEVDNSKSKLTIKQITCTFSFCLRLKSDAGKVTVIKENLLMEEVNLKIPPGAVLLNESAIEIKLNLPSKIDFIQNMYTTRGNFIDCMYLSEVVAEMSGLCASKESPAAESPMNIIPREAIKPGPIPSPPADWNPTILENVNIQYDLQFESTV